MEEKKFKRFERRALLLVFVCLLSLCSYKQTGSISGQLLDEVDRTPIANAVVISVWHAEVGNWHESGYAPLFYRETLTDNNGYFRVKRWLSFNPRNIMRFYRKGNPRVYIFKEGYFVPGPVNIKSNSWVETDGKSKAHSSGFSVERHKDLSVILLPRDTWIEDDGFSSYSRLEHLLHSRSWALCLAEELPTFIVRLNSFVSTEKYQNTLKDYRETFTEERLVNPLKFVCGLPSCKGYKTYKQLWLRGNICDQ